MSSEAKRPVDISSLETVLIWEALRQLASRTDDPVKRQHSLALLKKLGGKK